jgi:hypothetical protein
MTWITAIRSTLLALLIGIVFVPEGMAQGVYTAASCNLSDVNAVIHGSIHTAVTGDTIIIPAGTCTWTSTLSITVGLTLTGSGTPNSGTSTFGAGSPTTIIIDNGGSTSPIISVTGITYGQTATISLLDIEPDSSTASLISPITVAGTCSSSGCPQVRVDNVVFGATTPWTEAGNGAPADWLIRTDNVFGVVDHNTIPTGSNAELLNANLSAYLGVGGYGDNSWAQPDSFGTQNALYIENNNVYVNGQAVNDCDTNPAGGAIGGCRIVGRYNQITENGAFASFYVHGLDTDGRPQGGRQIEAYGNTITCIYNGGCTWGVAGFRSGTGFVFGNTLNASNGGFYDNIAFIPVYRTVFDASSGWGACGGSSPYDTDDGVVYYSGTNTGSSGATTLTDTSKSWTTNQFIPNGAPYSVYDATQGWWAEIASNTANTLTIQASIPEETNTFNSGDSYQILRATVCADQGGRGAGNYVSGATPSPAAPLSQALDPVYEFHETLNASVFHGNVASDTGRVIANRDWYTDNSAAQQTSASSPFNGSSGVGWGPTADRPTTCTPAVGYWATDANGGTGELYQCTATNTWTAHYTPYTYPHPLTVTSTSPATNLQATPH